LYQLVDKRVFEDGIGDGELLFIPVVAIDSPTPCAGPDIAVPVLDERGDEIVGEGTFIAFDVFVNGEIIAVVFIETVAGTQPHEPPAVLQDAGDVGLGKTGFRTDMLQLQPFDLAEGGNGNGLQ
jgi:hypothetical protein